MSIKIITVSGSGTTATLVLATVDGLEVGQCIRIYNTGNNKIDRRHQIATINTETDTITFNVPSLGTVAAFNPPNASLVPLTTWVKDEDVALFLGIDPATDEDAEYLSTVVEAANEFCYRRRRNCGYIDSRCIIPDPAAKEGTVLYAASLYRERGSVDSFQSFDSMSMPQPSLTMGRILQLLGCNRPQVA